jgi:hypothetical protein
MLPSQVHRLYCSLSKAGSRILLECVEKFFAQSEPIRVKCMIEHVALLIGRHAFHSDRAPNPRFEFDLSLDLMLDEYKSIHEMRKELPHVNLKDPLIFRQCIHLRDVAVLLNRGSYVEQYD